ncbi:hypothetical protein [Sulfitobacter mediterraneus]|uniref:hypothetical protein n=1 Tax=Sulfitobacter mediterraneus TaxID=83219 RepID=UPI0013C4A5AE|nr:hypothetical protein [Sulfitobacter mediterraneus]
MNKTLISKNTSHRDTRMLLALEEEQLLSTAEAVEWLAENGIRTSRRGLDDLRHQGKLGYFKVRGRIRILYRKTDLAAAFVIAHVKHQTRKTPRKCHHLNATISKEDAYLRALELAGVSRPT